MPDPVYFRPDHYVDWLTAPGLVSGGDYPEPVSLKKYLCAVGEYGGNAAALELQRAVVDVATTNKVSLRNGWKDFAPMGAAFDQLFTGQGRADHFMALFAFVHAYRADLAAWQPASSKAAPPLAKYFKGTDRRADFRQMVADGRFGMDCIGFVGRYFELIDVFQGWPGLYPRHYLDRFLPVRRIDDVAPMCVMVWVNGTHIAVIDQVVSLDRGAGTVKVNVCQSSDGEEAGPQRNVGVILQVARPDKKVLDLAAYANAVDVKNAPSEAEKAALRESLKVDPGATGYRGGLYFKIFHAGSPAAPVGGYVYVGRKDGLVYAAESVQ